MHGKHRRGSVSTAVLLSLMSVAPLAGAQAIADFDLPAQPLGDSLRAIAKQTDTNVLFDRGLINGRKAPALKGQASADAALSELLAGTGLAARYVDEKTIVVESADKSREPLRKENAGSRSSQQSPGAANGAEGPARIRLAQAQTAGSRESSGVSARRNVIELEEIVVTGTHIRGIENATAPVTVLSRAYINSTGLSTTTALLESLPQNFALTSQSGVTIPGVSTSRHQGAAINLRGVGEGTTLVLLNGRRIAPGYRSAAADIAALPLSAIEQVEILTDGASALYGSDAVGGVVNFILRDDFEGAETSLRSGWADGGLNEYRVSQALGNQWDSGNALLSMEYYKRDLLLASDRDFVPSTSVVGSLLPRDENYSAVFSAQQGVSGAVSLFADALYSQRDSYNFGGRTNFGEDATTDNPQLTATAGLNWRPGGDWQIEVAGNYSKNKLEQDINGTVPTSFTSEFEIQGAQVMADGSVLQLSGGPVRVALGAEWRSETYDELTTQRATGLLFSRIGADQTVRSAFGEVYVPIVGEGNAVAGVHRLELSVAGRYDEYSDAGSSFDPRAGIMWEPVSGLRFRGSYGTSYKAPNLVDYTTADNRALAFFVPVAGTHVFQMSGIDVLELSPQESESSSIGLEFLPDAIEGLEIDLNYYRIEYTDQIANPPTNALLVLGNPGAYGSLIVNDPSVAQVNEFIALANLGRGFFPLAPNFTPNPNFTPESVDVIVDLRRRNLSVVKTNGLDFSGRYDWTVGKATMSLGLAATYILDLETQVTETSEPVDTVDTIYNPPKWRARGSMGWRLHGWAANLFVNHTDSYTDNRPPARTPVSSYTTVDARLAYDFSSRFASGVLSGLTIAASVQNLLDEDPPSTRVILNSADMGFDPTNANPLGRFIGIEMTKSW